MRATAPSGGPYEFLVAADHVSRHTAFRFAQGVYAAEQLAPDAGLCVSAHDATPEMIVLLVVAPDGLPVATLSVLGDGALGLPCDETYREETEGLRRSGRRLIEMVRFASSQHERVPRLLLRELIALGTLAAARRLGGTDVLIEVNPRHVGFYRRLAGFEPIGPERACARVGGAPAVLLRGRLDVTPETVCHDARSQRRHPHAFFSPAEAELATGYLRRFTQSMSPAEAEALGIAAGVRARFLQR
jgi:hypothetical protein